MRQFNIWFGSGTKKYLRSFQFTVHGLSFLTVNLVSLLPHALCLDVIRCQPSTGNTEKYGIVSCAKMSPIFQCLSL